MNIFQKGMNKILVARVAKHIGKVEFLNQLYTAWYPAIKINTDITQEMERIEQRIKALGMKNIYDVAGITQEDIKGILEKIIKDKAKQ